MREIELIHPHERKHFEYFRSMNHPHFSLCAEVDVTPLIEWARERGARTTSAIVWGLARAANEVARFRWRIRGDRIVEHDVVHPSFSVAVDDEGVEAFSFCEVEFSPDPEAFAERAEARMDEVRVRPVFEDEPGRDDYLFMSAIPWVRFTGVTHAMSYHPHDSVPRVTGGRFLEEGGRVTMPLSVQAHHALVDGVHAGRFFETVEALSPRDLTRS